MPLPQATVSSAFSPFAEYSSLKKTGSMNSTTFSVSPGNSTFIGIPSTTAVAPVELVHSSDSVQALPIVPNFKPIKVGYYIKILKIF